MQITVSGKQIDLSDALRFRVNESLSAITTKYFGHALEAQVTFSRARSFFTCDINLHAGRGLNLRAEGEAADAHSAFDDAAEHLAKRLRRYRRRMNEHARDLTQRERARPETGRLYVLEQREEGEEAGLEEPVEKATANNGTSATEMLKGAYATIVAETPTEIATLTVSEAVMHLDLADQQVLMFRNLSNGQLNVVYRRNDGHIGWISPTASSGGLA